MASKLQLPADDSVTLIVSHSNLTSFSSDVRVSQQTTVEALKEKLWKKTGTAVVSMRLELRDEIGARVADLDRDAAPLAAYSPYDGYWLHIVDLDPSSVTSGGWLEDTSLVEKYTISDEAYDKLGKQYQPNSPNMTIKQCTLTKKTNLYRVLCLGMCMWETDARLNQAPRGAP
uniref:Uncharacterized protein n=1 Tax=Avena sativa TaxID=4498 RepID=A0ACD6AK11_AVESA